MLIVSYIVISPMEINYYGDTVLFLQSISFWVSLQRVCRPAVDRVTSRRKCPPRWWLPVFDVCVGNAWSAYILMQCYYPVDGITLNSSSSCSVIELATYVAATIFMFLSAFCHYQTHMMLEETRPLRPRRGANIDEIVADALLDGERGDGASDVIDYGSWYYDEKDVTGEGQGVPSDFDAQVEGAVKEEIKIGSSSSSSSNSSSNSSSSNGSSSSSSSSSSSNIVSSPSSKSNGPAGEGICPICMDKPQNAVCIPCGHTAGCFVCLVRNQREKRACPICRALVRQVMKIHRV